ncbi:MAG: proteasome-activating nucleotidase [DPANN group archaeon]|nr:proteasome-activating nucleotidase [DPANN group archaeon]
MADVKVAEGRPSFDLNDYVFELEERVQRLELEKKIAESNTVQLRTHLESARNELNKLKTLPLLVATVVDKLDDEKLIVKNPNGLNFLIKTPMELYDKIDIGARLGLNQHTLAIIEILPTEKDSFITAAEVIEKPNIKFADIGGLKDQIIEIRETIELPLTRPELFQKVGIKAPKGVLLYGPPGTGKTLLAKAVANEIGGTFIKLTGSELVRKFIGEGSKLVKQVFTLAKEKAPTVLFIDEIDAVATKRLEETTGGDREVNRTLMQLLAEMDGFDSSDNVRVIGATNRIDILDPALLRPGRFDRIIEIPLPDEGARHEIFRIHTEPMNTKRVPHSWLVEQTQEANGAEIKSICTEAGMFAIRNNRPHVLKKDFESAIDKVLGEQEAPGEEGKSYS